MMEHITFEQLDPKDLCSHSYDRIKSNVSQFELFGQIVNIANYGAMHDNKCIPIPISISNIIYIHNDTHIGFCYNCIDLVSRKKFPVVCHHNKIYRFIPTDSCRIDNVCEDDLYPGCSLTKMLTKKHHKYNYIHLHIYACFIISSIREELRDEFISK